MVAQALHGETDRTFQMVVNRILAAVCIDDHFIVECLVAGFAHILADGREQPQRIVCTVGRVTGLLDIFRIVRSVFMAGIVVELDQRQTAAVVYLCRQHKADLFCGKLRIQVNDALDILYRIPIAVAVAQTAVYKGCCTGPDKGNETLISVPYVDHVVEGLRRCVYLEVVQLAVPVSLQCLDFFVYLAGSLIGCQDLVCLGVVLLTQYEDQFLGLARLERDIALECAAGIAVVVHLTGTLALLYCDGVGIGAVRTDKAVQIAVIAGDRCADHAEETLSMVGTGSILAAVLVDVLEDLVALKAGACDEQGVLEVDLVLLVVIVVGELYETECRQVSRLVAVVGDDSTPYLIGSADGNIICDLRRDAGIVCGNHGISCAVAADALVGIQRLAYRLPGGRPVVLGVVVTQVDVASRQRHHGVEPETADSAVCARLDKAVAGSVVRDHCAVFRGTQVVDPGCRRIRMIDDILFVFQIKVTILHK